MFSMLIATFDRLLDVLAGRTETKGIEGHVLIDGLKPPKNFKCMTGYVVQVICELFLSLCLYVSLKYYNSYKNLYIT